MIQLSNGLNFESFKISYIARNNSFLFKFSTEESIAQKQPE